MAKFLLGGKAGGVQGSVGQLPSRPPQWASWSLRMCFILSDCRQLAASCPSAPAAREDKQAQPDNPSFQGRRSPSLELFGGLSSGEKPGGPTWP